MNITMFKIQFKVVLNKDICTYLLISYVFVFSYDSFPLVTNAFYSSSDNTMSRLKLLLKCHTNYLIEIITFISSKSYPRQKLIHFTQKHTVIIFKSNINLRAQYLSSHLFIVPPEAIFQLQIKQIKHKRTNLKLFN